jgi:hypothetical protein
MSRPDPAKKTRKARVAASVKPPQIAASGAQPQIPPSGTQRQISIDRILTLFGIAVGIVFYLLPKTPGMVVIGCVGIFACLVHPLWNLRWVEDEQLRRAVVVMMLLAACVFVGKVSWPKDGPIPVAVIEPNYKLEMMGLPIKFGPYTTTRLICIKEGRKVDVFDYTNSKPTVESWPGNQTLYPPEAVGMISLINHGDRSAFNVEYHFSIEIGAQQQPGGMTSTSVDLPLFDIRVNERSPVFFIVNESKDVGVVRLSQIANGQVQGSQKRTSIRVQPRDLTISDRISWVPPSRHEWRDGKILPPYVPKGMKVNR